MRGLLSPLLLCKNLMGVEDQVREIAEEAIKDDKSLFLVGVKLKGNPGNQRLLIWVDGDDGVTIDQCVAINRKISVTLDENENLIPGKYQLEVSSAGIDHPLQFLRQYKKNIGRSLKVKLTDGREMKGELIKVEDRGITLLEGGSKTQKELEIIFDEVQESKVLVSFK